MALIFVVPPRERFHLAIGAVLFALMAGVLGMCIPARSKWAFIVPPIVIVFVAAALIGNSSK